ncbi:acyltransferase [Leptothoe sp. PORK10 BA2]|uniref:acyltransferase n=1 Tax=Leptothoe sp. PORK10 BA2 TaxID=3110254 RepID=UPI002B21AC85|nr:acyltransferase family protein [Leptothoe sp. PORK10 BA2]MEA5464331.1 acyltransferase family protein [Leptothoe sp. PORK10 BA2]
MDKSTFWLDNSRVVSILAVILLHVTVIVMVSNDIGSTYWWFGNIYNSSVRWCVPVFVMISGALLLSPDKQENATTFYKKRVARLCIPISTWSLFFLVWRFIKGTLKGDPPTPIELLGKLLLGNPYEHLWFLFMILGLYLFTPFFRKIIATTTDNELNLAIIATFALASINHIYRSATGNDSEFFINWFLLYIPFFLLGHRIRSSVFQPRRYILWITFFISIVLTALGCFTTAVNNNLHLGLYFDGYLSLTVIPMSVSMMYLLKGWNTPIFNRASLTKKLSILTLGIYLIHLVFLEVFIRLGYATKIHPFISVPTVTVVVFTIALAGSWILSHTPYLKQTI